MKSEKEKTERVRTKSDEANVGLLSPKFDEGAQQKRFFKLQQEE